jgi:AcrR family transcriptional regulator
MAEPAYARLNVDERRRQIIAAGNALFAEHAYEEISMREIAQRAGISKALLYHYFPSKTELFKAAVQEHAEDLAELLKPAADQPPLQALTTILDGYLAWIDGNAQTWSKLLQSASSLPEAGDLVADFRDRTLEQILARVSTQRRPRPALRTAVRGWLGYIDAAILDWLAHRDLDREQLRDLLLAAFGAAVLAAQQVDPKINLRV